MGGEQQQVLQMLAQKVEQEAHETREKLRQSRKIEQKEEEPSSEKKQNEADRQTQVKLNVEESKLFKEKVSIFAQKKENSQNLNIFANSKSVNFFNLAQNNSTNGGTNIFKMAATSQPSVPTSPQDINDLNSECSEVNALEQVLAQPSEKIMKYQYEARTVQLAKFKVRRFKNGQNKAAKEFVSLSIEREKEQKEMNSAFYLIVRNNETNLIVYEGYTVPNTKMEHFMNKDENWKLWALTAKRTQGKIDLERECLRIQFENTEDATKFKEVICGVSEEVKKEQ